MKTPKQPERPATTRPVIKIRTNLKSGENNLFDSQSNISSDDCGPRGEPIEA